MRRSRFVRRHDCCSRARWWRSKGWADFTWRATRRMKRRLGYCASGRGGGGRPFRSWGGGGGGGGGGWGGVGGFVKGGETFVVRVFFFCRAVKGGVHEEGWRGGGRA